MNMNDNTEPRISAKESNIAAVMNLSVEEQGQNSMRSEWQIMYEQYKRSSEFLKKSYSDLLSREILEKQGKDIFSLARFFKDIADSNIKLAQSDDIENLSLKLQYCNDAAIACHHGLSVIEKADDRIPSLQELENRIYGNLNIVQTTLVSLCGGKLNDLPQINSRGDIDIISNRYMLEQLRNETKDHLKAIETAKEDKDDPAYIERTANLFKQIAKAMENYLAELYKNAQEIIGPPPCDYTVIGLGSMALRQMTPYSDLEFAILTANEDYKQSDDFKVKEYFKNLTQIVHFKVINLGETVIPTSSYNFDFKNVVKTAVNFDLGGKTPLGRIDHEKPYELIQTVEGMYDYLRNGWDKTSHIDKTLLFILQKTCLVYQSGETNLAAKYQELAQEFLLSIDESNGRPHCENRAVQILHKGGVEIDYTKQVPVERKPTAGNLEQFSFEPYKNKGKLFDVKQEIYRMPDRFIYNLGLIHGVQEESSWDTIDKLYEKGLIGYKGATNLKQALSFATNLRLKTYSHYGYQKDTMDFDKIYRTETASSRSEDLLLAKELTTIFRLTQEDLEPEGTLFEYYYVALALTYKLKEFCELHDKGEQIQGFFIDTDFRQDDAGTKAKVNLRLLKYEEALKYHLEGLAILEQTFGKDHPAVAWNNNDVGGIYGKLGNHREALKYKEKALEIWKKALGEDYPHVALCYNNVGITYGDLGNHKKALEYKEKALEIWKKTLPEDHQHVVASYNNIGGTYGKLGNHQKALEYQKKALKIRKQAFGQDHPDIAESYNNVGRTYGDLGNHQKALDSKQKALAIREQTFGKAHPDVATSYNDIGMTYGDLGNYKKALEYQEQALAISEQALGKDHQHVAAIYNNVGDTYGVLGNYEKALEYHGKALAIFERAFGKGHPDVATSYNNIGMIYGKLGNHRQALEYHLKALEISGQAFGKDHPDVATSYNNIGMTYDNLSDYQKALEYLLEALAIREQTFGKDHPHVATSYNNIGMAYVGLGDYQKALEYLLEALAIREQTFKKDHPDIASSYNNVAMAYAELGDHQTALNYLADSLAILEQALGKDHPNIAKTRSNIEVVIRVKDPYKKAIDLLTMQEKLIGSQTSKSKLKPIYRNAIKPLEEALKLFKGCGKFSCGKKIQEDILKTLDLLIKAHDFLNQPKKSVPYKKEYDALEKRMADKQRKLEEIEEYLLEKIRIWEEERTANGISNINREDDLSSHSIILESKNELSEEAIIRQNKLQLKHEKDGNIIQYDHCWYDDAEITSLLRAQIDEAQGRILAITRFENSPLLEDNLKNALEGIRNDGIPVLMPIHVHGNHWVGAVIRKQQIDGNIQVIYNDPRGNSIQDEENVVSFISMIQQYAPEANIIDLQIKQQENDDDCGPFTVDNLVRLATVYNIDNCDREQLIDMDVLPKNNTGTSIREAHRKILDKIEEERNSVDEPENTKTAEIVQEIIPVSEYSGTDLSLISDTTGVTTPAEEEILPLGDLDRET